MIFVIFIDLNIAEIWSIINFTVDGLCLIINNEMMKQQVPVSTIMSKNVIKLNISDDLTKAESLFKKYKIRHIPVVRSNKIVGILSFTDLLRISFVDAIDDDAEVVDVTVYNMFTVEQVMAKKLVTVTPDHTIKEVAEILSSREFHALPVVEGDLLVGIVTTTDLIKYLIAQY